MDFRIGAKSPVYGARQTAKVTDKQLKQSFAMKMAEVKPPRQDTVEISGSPLAKRLEGIHQKINEMDFAGKSSEEVYRTILDTYDEELGIVNGLVYTDRDAYMEIESDRQNMFKEKIPDYEILNKTELHYCAMGYDKMTKSEKIAAINERVGGNGYVQKYVMLAELTRAGVITSHQNSTIAYSLYKKSEKEYCAAHGLNYIQWSMGKDVSGESMEQREKSFMAWAAKTDVTWLEVFQSVHENPALWDAEKDMLLKELEGTSELLIGSDNI